MTIVMALGGNALIRAGERGTAQEQQANADRIADAVAAVWRHEKRIVVTHGNGPQVGNIALQQELGSAVVPAQPLPTLVAMTQGQLGSLLALALNARGVTSVASVITHVVVEHDDPAFGRPTKPVGPFLDEETARTLAAKHGWNIADDAGRGWRRVVPSPRPRAVVEAAPIERLAAAGAVVIAGGGGGVPVVARDGRLTPVDGVIDKDLAAAMLATTLDATTLVLVTDVPAISLDYGTPQARPVDELTIVEAQGHLAAGQFAAGSMGPKVTAAIQFLAAGGELALITNADHVAAGLAGRHGTRLVSGSPVRTRLR
jgi:carbamate kinase